MSVIFIGHDTYKGFGFFDIISGWMIFAVATNKSMILIEKEKKEMF